MITSRQDYKIVPGDLALVDIQGKILAQNPPVTFNSNGVYQSTISGRNVVVRGEDLCWLGECIMARKNINSGSSSTSFDYEFKRSGWPTAPATGVRSSLPPVYDNLRTLYYGYNNLQSDYRFLKDVNGAAPSCMSGLYTQFGVALWSFGTFGHANPSLFWSGYDDNCYCAAVDQLSPNLQGAARIAFMESRMPKMKWGLASGDISYSGMSWAFGNMFLFQYGAVDQGSTQTATASGNIVVTLHHPEWIVSVRPFYAVSIGSAVSYHAYGTPSDIVNTYAVIANNTYTPVNGVVTLNPVSDIVAAAKTAPGVDFGTSVGGDISSRSSYIKLEFIELYVTLDDAICSLTAPTP